MQVSKFATMQLYDYPPHKHTTMRVYKYKGMYVCNYARMQVYRYQSLS